MNIVIISEGYLPELSGVTVSLYNKLVCLSKFGHNVRLYVPDYSKLRCCYPGFASHSGKIMDNVEVISFPSRRCHIKNILDPKPFSFRYIKKSIIDFNPDVIHVECPERLFLGFLIRPGVSIARKNNIPITAMFHTDYLSAIDDYKKKLMYLRLPGIKFLFKRLLRWVYNSYDVTLVSSQHAKECLKGLGVKKITCGQFFGVDAKLFQVSPKRKFLKDKVIVNYTGRLSLEKRIDFLLQVFEAVKSKTDACIFSIIGDGEEASKIKNWIKGHPEDMFFGSVPINEIHKYYLFSDIFVTACPNETFGLTILEAMAAGLPIVAPDTINIRNLVSNNEMGYLLPFGDVELFANAIVKLASSFHLRDSMRIRAANKAKTFVWEQATLNMVDVWKKMLGCR